jgi:hypothetical protein
MNLDNILYLIEERRVGEPWRISKKLPATDDLLMATTGLDVVKKCYHYKFEYRIGLYERVGEIK